MTEAATMAAPGKQAKAAQPGNILTIQIARAIAAMAVLVFHLGDGLKTTFGLTQSNFFPVGSGGVDLFFVISGFIICYTTQRPKDQNVASFAIKRSVRIVPLYWLLTLGVFSVALITPHLLQSTVADPTFLAKSLGFIPYMRPDGAIQPTLYLGWTLNYEMFFYAIFALALFAGRHRVYVASAAILFIVALGLVLKPTSAPLYFWTDVILLEFLWGVAVFVVFEKAPRLLRAIRWTWPLFALMILAQNYWMLPVDRAFALGLPAAGLLACLTAFRLEGNNPLVKAFVKLGDVSYSLYLVHPYVIMVCFLLVTKLFAATPMTAALAFVLSTVGSIIASLILFECVEKPSNSFLRKLFLRQRPKQLPA